jgi:hypothetical protein
MSDSERRPLAARQAGFAEIDQAPVGRIALSMRMPVRGDTRSPFFFRAPTAPLLGPVRRLRLLRPDTYEWAARVPNASAWHWCRDQLAEFRGFSCRQSALGLPACDRLVDPTTRPVLTPVQWAPPMLSDGVRPRRDSKAGTRIGGRRSSPRPLGRNASGSDRTPRSNRIRPLPRAVPSFASNQGVARTGRPSKVCLSPGNRATRPAARR